MKKTNPWKPMFTEDLEVENLEVGNAFWGYHISNNFARILNVDGTCFFPARTTLSQGVPQLRETAVNIQQLGLQRAPIVRIYARPDVHFETATALFVSTVTFGPNFPPIGSGVTIPSSSVEMVLAGSGQWTQPVIPENYIWKWGTYSELMRNTNEVRPFFIPVVNQTIWTIRFERGWYSTPEEISGEVRATIALINDVTIQQFTGNAHYEDQPPYVQAMMDDRHLFIRWMHDSAGTVYYKILGG